MTELVAKHPFSVNGNSYQIGDIVARADEKSVLEHVILRGYVSRRNVEA